MAKWLLFFTIVMALAFNEASARGKGGGSHRSSTVHVKSYTTKAGKHVSSHRRTGANHTKRDNWSTKGNVNPDTGKAGTVDP